MPDAPGHIIERAPASLPLPGIDLHVPQLAAPLAAKKKPRRKRQQVIGVRLDDAELAQLETRAGDAGLTIGAFIRACALGDAGPRARKRPPVDRALLIGANAALNRVGNNVNQIAHALNSGDGIVRSELVRTMTELRAVLTEIRRALGHDRQG